MGSHYEFAKDRFSASSGRPDEARLNGYSAWLPSTNSGANDYLQINLYDEFVICAVATQGNPRAYHWTKKYKLILSLDNQNWITYKENGTDKVCNKLFNLPPPSLE